MSQNVPPRPGLSHLAKQKKNLINELPIHNPFKYLGSESTPSGNTKHQFSMIN